MGPATNEWVKLAEVPQPNGGYVTVRGIAVNETGIYLNVLSYAKEVKTLAIIRYKNRNFDGEWETIVGELGDAGGISATSGVLWAGGTKAEEIGENIRYTPVVVRKRGGFWEAVPGPNPGTFRGVGRVFAVSEDECGF